MKLTLQTKHPLAVDSPDHTHPWGTARDNSRHAPFNDKLLRLLRLRSNRATGPFHILDLGCSGGGFVKDLHDLGHLAVGLEGSDYSQRARRAEWATIPERLFTCDITQPFRLHAAHQRQSIHFHAVTAWEVLEHLTEAGVAGALANVIGCLASEDGLFIASISTTADAPEGVDLHQTVRPRAWWEAAFVAAGLEPRPDLAEWFGEDWIRGPKQGAPHSFHLVATVR